MVLGLVALASCGKSAGRAHDHEGHDHGVEAVAHDHAREGHDHEAEVAAHGAGASDEIVVSPEKAEAAGIVVEAVRPAAFREVIATSGQVLPVQGSERTLVANVAGVVSFPRPLVEGMAVRAQTVLLTLSSAHLQDGDPAERARIAYETAKTEYERAQRLVDDRIVSQKDFNTIRERYENARLAYEALLPSGNGQGVAVRAAESGYVKACLVKEGDYVAVGQPLVTLVRNDRLYLRADVPERYYSRLADVSTAHFRTSDSDTVYRLDDWHGRLLAYGQATGGGSYYVPVTFELDNPGNVLPGAYAEVFLLGRERAEVISVPRSALTEEQGVHFVYLQLDASCYRKQAVTLGATDGQRVEIRSGLQGGERLVTRGAIHVKLASASNAIPAHTHNH